MPKRKYKYKNKYSTFSLANEFIPDAEFDFHKYKALDPYDIEKLLSEFIEDSYLAGHRRVLVITGKGRVVRPFVQKCLKENKYVGKFKTAGYFNGQDGAFEVTLK